MEEKLSIMNSRFNKRVLIDMFVWNDDRDSSRHIIYVRKIFQGIIYVLQNYNTVICPTYRLAFHTSYTQLTKFMQWFCTLKWLIRLKVILRNILWYHNLFLFQLSKWTFADSQHLRIESVCDLQNDY